MGAMDVISSGASFEDNGDRQTGYEEERGVDLVCGGRWCTWWISQE